MNRNRLANVIYKHPGHFKITSIEPIVYLLGVNLTVKVIDKKSKVEGSGMDAVD